MRLHRLAFVAAAFAMLAISGTATARAQVITRPYLEWQTVETAHFAVHFPAPLREWSLAAAERLESVHGAVSRLVGSAPAARINVIVDDPLNVANGSAWPGPSIFLWPTPPEPRSAIGTNRDWAEILTVHEYAHIAHLTRPSRNRRERLLRSMLPVDLTPIMSKSPRWVTEGYATYVEGRLTGSGRPHGVWRPAIIRQWAIEGRLPSYGVINGSSGYFGGSMAYLVGSAYLQWLDQRAGAERLPDVWARMTARQSRGFPDAFAGVYGGLPQDLYGRFVAEVTGRALEVERQLRAAGLAEGSLVQARDWATGDPAVSPDGTHLAVTLYRENLASRLVVWKTVADTITDRERQQRERMRRLDPQDVPAIEWRPRPRRAVATLAAVDGRGHDAPRFMPDGERILVTRSEPRGDGTARPDLFLWNWKRGTLRRVTRGAGIRYADPAPDGRSAVGVRCLDGTCDVVRIDLQSGELRTLLDATPTRNFNRPRFSPDGSRMVVGVQERGYWRLATMAPDGTGLRAIGPDDRVSRFDGIFTRDGRSIIASSEAGGILNLELINPATGATRPLTRVTGAAVAADQDRATGWVYFLKLHGKGLDLQRIHPDSTRLERTINLPQTLAPAIATPAGRADSFPRQALPAPRRYGLGPRYLTVLPSFSGAREGMSGGLALAGTDPIGRLTWTLEGRLGSAGTWRGAGLSASWRGSRPALHGNVFWMRQRSSAVIGEAVALDANYTGGLLATSYDLDLGAIAGSARVGASLGALDQLAADRVSRTLAFGEVAVRGRRLRDGQTTSSVVGVQGTLGRTGDASWRRLVASTSLLFATRRGGVRASATYGELSGNIVPFELLAAGGTRPPLADPALLAQRLAMPALPVATIAGPRIVTGRVSLVGGSALEPYFWVANASRGFEGDWYRVVGLERTFDAPTSALLRVPGVRATAGVAYTLDAPERHEVRAYAGVSYHP